MATYSKGNDLTIEDAQIKESIEYQEIKLDKHGLPLVPQPSNHSDDPLNWSPSLKLSVALQVSWLAFVGPMSSAVGNPAFVPIGKAFHITTVEASYSLTMYIIWAAVGPLLAVPLANTFGRRPVYLVGNLVAGICNVAGGYSPSWAGVMATRAFVGIFAGSPATIGPATICDMYFMHERGFYMGVWATLPTRKIKISDFWRPLYMAKYLTVLLPALYYMTCFGYGSVLFAATGSQLFAKTYHFELYQTGLLLSIPLLVGCFIGECSTGWFIDWLVSRYAKHHGGERRPEARLDGLWLGLLVPIGVIIQGACLYHHKSWVGTAFGMGLANLGLQAATTVTYAYTTDYYKSQSTEIACFLNLMRNGFSALISFYAIPLAEEINIEYAWLIFALLNVAFFVPFLGLKWFGPKVSKLSWQTPPSFHNDL
ncbi:hypothetical protein LTR27_004019 [Elasticomyces elasticus]|nr:hypothetical protein LTR27_004019 [Elasticomyces elasticus]